MLGRRFQQFRGNTLLIQHALNRAAAMTNAGSGNNGQSEWITVSTMISVSTGHVRDATSSSAAWLCREPSIATRTFIDSSAGTDPIRRIYAASAFCPKCRLVLNAVIFPGAKADPRNANGMRFRGARPKQILAFGQVPVHGSLRDGSWSTAPRSVCTALLRDACPSRTDRGEDAAFRPGGVRRGLPAAATSQATLRRRRRSRFPPTGSLRASRT